MQDVGHRQVRGLGGGVEEGGEVARSGGAPERVVGGAAGAAVADAEQRGGGAPRAGPGGRRAERRPHRVPERGGLGGVEHPGLAELGARGEGVEQDVGLDRGRQDGSVPLAHRGHDQPGGLARLGRSDDHHRRALLGGDQGAAVVAERDPPRLGPPDAQLGEVDRVAHLADRFRGAASRSASRRAATPRRPWPDGDRARSRRTACSSAAPGRSAAVGGRPRERRAGTGA